MIGMDCMAVTVRWCHWDGLRSRDTWGIYQSNNYHLVLSFIVGVVFKMLVKYDDFPFPIYLYPYLGIVHAYNSLSWTHIHSILCVESIAQV